MDNDNMVVVTIEYTKYVIPFEEGVAVIRAMNKAEKVVGQRIGDNYLETLPVIPATSVSLESKNAAQILQMRLYGEQYEQQKAAEKQT